MTFLPELKIECRTSARSFYFLHCRAAYRVSRANHFYFSVNSAVVEFGPRVSHPTSLSTATQISAGRFNWRSVLRRLHTAFLSVCAQHDLIRRGQNSTFLFDFDLRSIFICTNCVRLNPLWRLQSNWLRSMLTQTPPGGFVLDLPVSKPTEILLNLWLA